MRLDEYMGKIPAVAEKMKRILTREEEDFLQEVSSTTFLVQHDYLI